MESRVSRWSNHRTRRIVLFAAAVVVLIVTMVAAFFYHRGNGTLTIEDARTGEQYGSWKLHVGDTFSVGFIHSVNKSPVTDHYELRSDGIYVVKTVYYGFGAGVQTELEDGQKLEYGEDGSMIITGFDRRMDDLIYFVGTVSDHTLVINEKESVSLRDLCGRNSMVRFVWKL